MDKPEKQGLEIQRILPNYSVDMDLSSFFDSEDDDSDLNLMTELYEEDKKKKTPPKKQLPKTKTVRVLVKRLKEDVVQKYLKKKNATTIGSTSFRPLQRPLQTPRNQQMLINKPQPKIHPIFKSLSSQQSPSVLNLHRNNNKQQLVAGQKPSGVYNSASPAPLKPHPNAPANLKNSHDNMGQIKRPLQQTEYTKTTVIKRHETTGSGNSAKAGNSSSSKNVSNMNFESSTSFIEMRRDTIQVRREVNRTSLNDFLSNYEEAATGGLNEKFVDGANSRKQSIISKHTMNQKQVVNSSIVMDKQALAKKDFENASSSNQQKQSLQQMDGHKNKETQSDSSSSQFMNLLQANKKRITTGTAAGGGNKNPTEKPLQFRGPDNLRKFLNINQASNNQAAASPKLVKQPKMVKVPISKLIKIPQGISINAKSTVKTQGMEKVLNSLKNLEKVNVSKVVNNSVTANEKKMPQDKTKELTKSHEIINLPTKIIKIPQAIQISKLVKSPDMVKIVKLPNTQNVKILNSKTTAKNPESQVILSKVVKMPEEDTTTGQLNATQQSQVSQINTTLKSHVKSTQTKFTCNDNICGIIDTAEFNINCFYCYDVFPLRKWTSFIAHMKSTHRLAERSHAAADLLFKPKNIIPYGMKSKEVQVNTLKVAKRKIDAPPQVKIETFIINENAAMHNMDSLLDDSQMENDLEMALNCLDDDGLDELANMKTNKQPPKKIVKLEKNQPHKTFVVNAKAEKIPQISIKSMSELNAKPSDSPLTLNAANKAVGVVAPKLVTALSDAVKANDHSSFKSKIINLPANIKIIKKLPNSKTNGEATKSKILPEASEQKMSNNSNKSKIVLNPLAIIKTEDLAETCKNNITEEFIDSISEDIARESPTTKTKETISELFECRLDDTSVEDKSLDISKTDVEQNVKIEPDFDNDSADETVLLRSKDESRKPSKKYMNTRKNQLIQKPRPIPANLLDSDDEMPSNDENEDEFPSPTNGCGILFGLTNRHIVMAFIQELQNYPDLWKFNRTNDAAINYTDSVRRLYQYINEKFNLEMTDFEVRLSVQRIKYWYCRTLHKLEQHNKMPQAANKSPFKYTFPEYFKILNKYLSYDSNWTKDLILGKRFQMKDVNEMNRYPKWMLYKEPAARGDGAGGGKAPDDRCSLAKDLEFSEDGGETDQEAEEEWQTRSLKPFKSELDTSANPPDPFICDICFVDFNSMVEVTRHRIKHFPPQYSCSTCKRMYYTSSAAAKCSHDIMAKKEISSKQPHNAKEQQEPPTLYVCEMCGVAYKSVGSLNYHKKNKHFNMRHKCPVCKFTSISNYRMLQHQKKRHVVDFGTCEEIAKKTRSRTDSKIPFSSEARREFEWRREMRKETKPGELFYGCYKCKLVFKTRREKVQHNREEHPITEATVMCLLCKKEKSLFSNTNSVRRHYTDVHKVPWDEIDELVKRSKPLFEQLTALEVDQLKSSDNPYEFVGKILAKKHKAEQQHTADMDCEITRAIKSLSEDIEEELNQTYDPFSRTKRQRKVENTSLRHNDEESMDDDDDYYQSSFFNDIGMDHGYDDMQDSNSYNEDDDDDDDDDDFYDLSSYDSNAAQNPEKFQQYEYHDDEGNEHYIIEEEFDANDEFAEIDVGQPGGDQQQLLYEGAISENSINEEEIVEEIVEYDFMEDVMEDRSRN